MPSSAHRSPGPWTEAGRPGPSPSRPWETASQALAGTRDAGAALSLSERPLPAPPPCPSPGRDRRCPHLVGYPTPGRHSPGRRARSAAPKSRSTEPRHAAASARRRQQGLAMLARSAPRSAGPNGARAGVGPGARPPSRPWTRPRARAQTEPETQGRPESAPQGRTWIRTRDRPGGVYTTPPPRRGGARALLSGGEPGRRWGVDSSSLPGPYPVQRGSEQPPRARRVETGGEALSPSRFRPLPPAGPGAVLRRRRAPSSQRVGALGAPFALLLREAVCTRSPLTPPAPESGQGCLSLTGAHPLALLSMGVSRSCLAGGSQMGGGGDVLRRGSPSASGHQDSCSLPPPHNCCRPQGNTQNSLRTPECRLVRVNPTLKMHSRSAPGGWETLQTPGSSCPLRVQIWVCVREPTLSSVSVWERGASQLLPALPASA